MFQNDYTMFSVVLSSQIAIADVSVAEMHLLSLIHQRYFLLRLAKQNFRDATFSKNIHWSHSFWCLELGL